ncbi:AAA family ATPase [Glycomyces arizonensis]|uniref:AAA family ATPase n=1 Tax=Glycomyces arizonensis TaxID=256035 RepID=UPI0003FE4996|nr:ATP-binding protein [Glycomyces arizonensis]
MLIGFKVSNFKSLRDEQELSMLPSRGGRDFAALPVAAIYGANASGKSSLIEALSFKDRMLDEWFSGSLFAPFLLDQVSGERSTGYDIEVELDGTRYEYHLSMSSAGVERERLSSYPHHRRRTLLERARDEITIGTSMTNRAALQVLSAETALDTPAITMAYFFKATEWQPFWQWLKWGLRTFRRSASNYDAELSRALDRHPVLLELAKVADLGLADMRLVAEPGPNPPGITRRRVQYFHKGQHGRPFTAANESRGTIAFLGYMADILDALEDGATLVIDEFDTSLHPRLIARIIELFQDPRTNPRNAQLIFSTHDASLLGTSFGEPILKRDEVWFVEKNEDGASELYPLTSFKPRKEHNLERHYLGGSYGAVPDIYPASLVDIVAAANEAETETE